MRGQRHADLKNGLTVPPRLTLRNAFDIATKPAWVARVLMGKRKTFGNIEAYLEEATAIKFGGRPTGRNEQFRPARSTGATSTGSASSGPASWCSRASSTSTTPRRAASVGADGIVVSNHGGRQLDGAPSTIAVLPEIADAVGDRTEVLFDGGIRSGQDVLKALALGASGCLIGRAYLYGLAAMGEAGVRKALDIIRQEMDIT